MMFKKIFGNNVQTIIGNCSNSSITINDKTYAGKSVSIINDKIIVDGVDVTPESKTINILIEGNVDNVDCQSCNTLSIRGNVSNLTSNTGDIQITGDVDGSVKNNVGNIKIGGNVQGGVKTNVGDIKYNKK